MEETTALCTFFLYDSCCSTGSPLTNRCHSYLSCSVRRVDLFGSWDNFQAAYPLERDLRVGSGQWSGCHKIKDIVCDGDRLYPTRIRDEGLKMGGTYWYFVWRSFLNPFNLTVLAKSRQVPIERHGGDA